jgi:two-component system cell cycle response regulator DivK
VARILIVEDTPDNLKLFRALLRRHGHDVIERTGGHDLVDTVRRERPALVLLDIQLPDRDGFELIGDLRAAFGDAVRVVALTAHAMPEDRARAFEAGFDDFITKPIDIARFPDQVSRAIAGG